ncbi:histone-like nucleoid-structuring protein Lsr2 [Propionicicella superfundia]|uniref:histone-like nucleoid-structuring protein Lsr2 n=1 Tax=Propionicicella superfundia TaxID=348582 RepID=UPI0003FFD811|nr:Lsr2 family protein [Propionicicella superfundia]
MAQRVEIILSDDVDGSLAAGTVNFAFDGVSYEIDLSEKNQDKFRDQMAVWIAHARKVRRASGGAKRTRTGGPTGSEIRAWAQEKGMQVNARGRVPAEIKAAYEAENG